MQGRLWKLLLLIGIAAGGRAAPVKAQEPACSPEGICIDPQFQPFWFSSGGLPVFGYALSSAAPELTADASELLLVQWTERARLEWHPELAGTPYAVLLGRLGVDRLAQQGRLQEPPAARQTGCRFFAETGHNLCNLEGDQGFLSYWQQHGLTGVAGDRVAQSLALLGLPLTEINLETNCSGDRVATQWFERARLEWHIDSTGAGQVLQGLLGSEVRPDQPCAPDVAPWLPQVPPDCPSFPQLRCVPPNPPPGPYRRLQEPRS